LLRQQIYDFRKYGRLNHTDGLATLRACKGALAIAGDDSWAIGLMEDQGSILKVHASDATTRRSRVAAIVRAQLDNSSITPGRPIGIQRSRRGDFTSHACPNGWASLRALLHLGRTASSGDESDDSESVLWRFGAWPALTIWADVKVVLEATCLKACIRRSPEQLSMAAIVSQPAIDGGSTCRCTGARACMSGSNR
jgi:hypothetical protein